MILIVAAVARLIMVPIMKIRLDKIKVKLCRTMTLIISRSEAVAVVDITQDSMTLMMDRMYKRVHLHKVHSIATNTSGPSSNAKDSQNKCKDSQSKCKDNSDSLSPINPVCRS